MKNLEHFKIKAETINNSILFYSTTANDCFDRIDELRTCYTQDCEDTKKELYEKAKLCIDKLEYEKVNLETYGKEIASSRNFVIASGFLV